jgi:hypothetical protein
MESWISYSLIISIKPMYLRYNPRGSIENWGAKFIMNLIGLTHKQWLYMNSDVHYVIDDLTALEHRKLTAKIGWLLRKNCMALLARH